MRYKEINIRLLILPGLILLASNVFCQISLPYKAASTKFNLPQHVPIINLKSFNNDSLASKVNKCKTCGTVYGINIPTQIDINNSGTWNTLPNGDRVWRIRIKSANAKALQIICDRFVLPEGGALFIYDIKKERQYGAFTAFNNRTDKVFSSQQFTGNDFIIEYNQLSTVTTAPEFRINEITYVFKNADDFQDALPGCHNNVNCLPWMQDWCNEIRATVKFETIVIEDGERLRSFCSGVVINNSNNDFRPLILTAAHCIQNKIDPNLWIVFYNWQSPTCANDLGNDELTTTGITILAQDPSNIGEIQLCPDVALLEVDAPGIPINYNVFFAGWNRLPSLPSDDVVGIHHPAGDIKKISFGDITGIRDLDACWTVNWSSGYTEGGSSGSPLFDSEHRDIGWLSNGPRIDRCEDDDNYHYGALWTSWPLLDDFLAPGHSEFGFLNGSDPIGSCQSDLQVFGSLFPGNDWQVKNRITIQAANTITAAPGFLPTQVRQSQFPLPVRRADYVFRAGVQVHLLPGFSVEHLSLFRAEIGPCLSFEGCGFNFSTAPVAVSEDQETTNKEAIQIYPNPTNGSINIQLPEHMFSVLVTIMITDATGRIIYEDRRSSITAPINVDLSQMPTGLYFVTISDNSRIETKRVSVIR